jgi:hypothetical protein
MALHSDLSAVSSCSNANCSDGWAHSFSPEEIGFLQLYDDRWLALGREKVVSLLKAAYALVADLANDPQVGAPDSGIILSRYGR